jgi:orotate phosphoribosyltransferase
LIFPSDIQYNFQAMNEKERLIELIGRVSFQYSEKPLYKLSSGAVSNYYFNMKKTTYSPEGAYLVGRLVFEKIREAGLHVSAIGGLTMGADPIAFAVARYSYDAGEPIHAFVVRKEPKEHGMRLQIEGSVSPGEHVVIVDDVVTTGASTIKAIKVAREHGLIVDAAIVLVDRCEQKGKQNVEELGLPVYDILTVHDFITAGG